MKKKLSPLKFIQQKLANSSVAKAKKLHTMGKIPYNKILLTASAINRMYEKRLSIAAHRLITSAGLIAAVAGVKAVVSRYKARREGRKLTKLASDTDQGAKAQAIIGKLKRIAQFVDLIERKPQTLQTKAYIRRLGTEINRIKDEIASFKGTKYYSNLRASMGAVISEIISSEKRKAAARN